MPQMVPPKWVPRTICGKLYCYGWSPDQVRLPQMGPLKLSLEKMSRGSYEVNLANMDCVIRITKWL